MAKAISNICKCPGCFKRAETGQSYCAFHLKQRKKDIQLQDRQRQSSYERGYNWQWRKLRKEFLITNPLCAECLKSGIIKRATDVDHIIPHKGDKNLFWNTDNLQALCHECHSRKTAVEDSNLIKKHKYP